MASWRSFMESSTIHGLPEIAKSDTKRGKMLYWASFVLAMCFTLYGCAQVLMQYQSNAAITTYFVQETDSLALPDITICPFNRLRRDYIEEHNISADLAAYIEVAFLRTRYVKLSFVETSPFTEPGYIKQFDGILDNLLDRLNISFEQLLNDASLKCPDVLTACFEKLYNTFDCCNSSTTVFSNLGRCFLVSRSEQKSAGIGQGVMIFIKLPVDQFVLGQDTALNDGVLLKLSEAGKGYESDAIFIPTQVHALVQLRATKFEFMKTATTFGCVEDDDPDYSPFACSYHCLLKPSTEFCKCRYIVGKPEPSKPVCKPIKVAGCILPYLGHYINSTDPDHVSKCRRGCPPRCSYWQYSATVSHAVYPSKLATQRFKLNHTLEQQPTLVLEVYHEKLEYTLIRHVPQITFDQLISDFGGQMGLWLGASILSCIHFLAFTFQSWFNTERVVKLKQASESKRRHKKRHSKSCSSGSTSKWEERASMNNNNVPDEALEPIGTHDVIL